MNASTNQARKDRIMPRLYIEESNTDLGEITEAELRSLLDNLEEESQEDTDYYITPDTLDYLAARGADAKLVAILRQAIGDQDGIDIRWSK
jgi:hypothetical protein